MAKSPKTLAAKAQKPASISSLALDGEAAKDHKTFKFGGLDLVITKAATLPADAPSGARASSLPFPELFTAMSVGEHFYLPDAFWEQRKASGSIDKKTVLDAAYVKGKVRTAFYTWRKADEKRADLGITVYTRPEGISPKDDPSFPTDPRPGHSLYITQVK